MTIKEAKEIDLVSYLSTNGHNPQKISGVNCWYLSPLRDEKTASFKINRKLNRWYDFGEGKGGDIIDLVVRIDGISIAKALQKLSSTQLANPSPDISAKKPAVIEILSTHIISSFALKRYIDQRRISPVIADRWLKEVQYKNGDREFYALGFKNNVGGYELRSPNFKGSSSPKSITLINNASPFLAVFEGFFDFLSYCTISEYQPTPKRDFLILNSASLFEQQLSIMQAYQEVHLYLDNDATGNKYTKIAIEINPQQFLDERTLFKPHKDLNDWLVYIGKSTPQI